MSVSIQEPMEISDFVQERCFRFAKRVAKLDPDWPVCSDHESVQWRYFVDSRGRFDSLAFYLADYNRGYTLEAAGRISRIIKFEEGAETSIYDQESQTWKFENWVSYV